MAAVSLAGLFAFHPKTSYATNPSVISFQGKVVNADGTNVTNGSYPFNFVLWDDPTVGTNRWQELSKSVTVTNGVFQTNLGSATTLPDFNAYPNLYLAIQFNNDAQGYMTPRIQLTSVPYAINSDKLGGLTSASFGQISSANSWTNTNSIQTSSASALVVQNASNKVLAVDTSANQVLLGNVGASGVNGMLVFNSATAGNYTFSLVASSSQAANINLTLPTAAPTTSQCLQTDGSVSTQLTFAACSTGGSGVTAVGAFSGSSQTNGASIAGSTITFGPADTTNPGMISTGSQTITGDKALKSTTNSTTAFQVQNAAGASIMRIDTTDTNLITNPGFEVNANNWVAANATAPTRDTTNAWGGIASGNLNNSTANTNEGFKQTLVTTLANNTYTVSWYAKQISGTALTDVIASYAPDGSTWTNCTNINTQIVITGAWTRYICQFTASGANSSNAVRIIQQAAGTRSWNIDGVQIDTGSQVTAYGVGGISLNANINSFINFKNTQDSTSAFQITDAENNNMMNVDTSATNLNNMLSNPSFETGTTGWAGKGSATIKQVSAGTVTSYEGLNSMEITTTAAANDGAYYAVTLGASTTYTINLYARLAASGGTPVSTINIGRQDQSGTNVDSCTGNIINSSGWTRLSCTFTTGGTISSSNIYVSQSDATVRKIYVDSITLETVSNATSNYRNGAISLAGSIINSQLILQNASNSNNAFQVQNAAGVQVFNISTDQTNNLISNPGFEVNTTGWAASGTGSIIRTTAQTYLGVASLKVVSQAAANSGAQFSLNPVVTAASTTYTISFYGRFDSGSTTPTLNIRYSPDGSATSDCSVTAINLTTMVSTGWTRYYCAVSSATAPTTSGFVRIMQTDTATHTYYIDAVQMEPTTVANMTAYGAGTLTLNGIIASPTIFKSSSNSVTAFQVQNVAGTNLLAVDTLNSAVTLGNTTLSSGTQTINLGNANTSGGTTNVYIGSGSSATGGVTTITAKGALTLTGNAASTWSTGSGLLTITGNGGTTITGNTGVLTVGNTGLTGLGLNLLSGTYTNAERGVAVGTSDGNITMFDPDISTASGAETAANCTTAINAGGIYYSAATASSNTITQELRGCINGAFRDIIAADQLGVMLLGVVEDSGAANQGDIGGISGVANGPCKVSWASTTSVSVAPCTAYSAGRKVVITAATAVSSINGATLFYHICLSGTNGAPTATAGNASETAAVPAFSATAPILCLATVKTGGSSTITNIYDTRVFVSSRKQFSTINAAVAPGMVVTLDGTNANRVITTASAAAANVRGVVAVGTTAASTTAVNTIIATGGPAFVEGTGTITVGQTAQTSTTAGYAQSAASAAAYKDLGLIIWPGVTTGCTASTDCQYSMLVDVGPH